MGREMLNIDLMKQNTSSAAVKAVYQKQIADYLQSKLKSVNSDFKIGTELEHFLFTVDNTYVTWANSEPKLQTLLTAWSSKDGYKSTETVVAEPINVLADNYTITLEPGGQLEASLEASASLSDLHGSYSSFLKDFHSLAGDTKLVYAALNPLVAAENLTVLPKPRYLGMEAYFTLAEIKTAPLMMKSSAALQIALDYTSETDFEAKYRLAILLSEFFYQLSNNSLFYAAGLNYHKQSLRHFIWHNFDKSRSGTPTFVKQRHFGFQDYADYVLTAASMFAAGNFKQWQVSTAGEIGSTHLDILLREAKMLEEQDIEQLLSFVFPDVRLKAAYIELRMFDSVPYPLNFAFIALVKGLFNKFDTVATLNNELGSKLAHMSFLNTDKSLVTALWDLLAYLLKVANEHLPANELIYLDPLRALLAMRKRLIDIAYENINLPVWQAAIFNWEAGKELKAAKSFNALSAEQQADLSAYLLDNAAYY